MVKGLNIVNTVNITRNEHHLCMHYIKTKPQKPSDVLKLLIKYFRETAGESFCDFKITFVCTSFDWLARTLMAAIIISSFKTSNSLAFAECVF